MKRINVESSDIVSVGFELDAEYMREILETVYSTLEHVENWADSVPKFLCANIATALTGTLEVEFVRTGKIAQYFDVPYEKYTALLASLSVGSAFNALVKNANYAWEYAETTDARVRALNEIDNILACKGYSEVDGNTWLGPRLMHVRDYIEKSEVK